VGRDGQDRGYESAEWAALVESGRALLARQRQRAAQWQGRAVELIAQGRLPSRPSAKQLRDVRGCRIEVAHLLYATLAADHDRQFPVDGGESS
jgi:hypothetical protein